MIGVNISSLDTLIKKNDLFLNSFKDNSRELINCITELRFCYNGSCLEYLFSEPMNEIKNINMIESVVRSYSITLKAVRSGYQQQDLTIKTRISHINSKL